MWILFFMVVYFLTCGGFKLFNSSAPKDLILDDLEVNLRKVKTEKGIELATDTEDHKRSNPTFKMQVQSSNSNGM